MNIAGIWSGHDASFAILENGRPLIHAEWERYIREKEPKSDAIRFMLDRCPEDADKIQYLATCYPIKKMTDHAVSFNDMISILKKNCGRVYVVGHHQAHAANAFFSSNYNEALIITMDGGGIENDKGLASAFTVWEGRENQIMHVHTYPLNQVNIGGMWTRATRYIFRLQSGWPLGHQAGTVMAMAALGDPNRFKSDFYRMLTDDLQMASMKPSDQPIGAYAGNDPRHPYLGKYTDLADSNEQTKFDLAAGLQAATEEWMFELINITLAKRPNVNGHNLCLAGGVSLNSLAVGKIKKRFENRVTGKFNDIYCTPTPHDGGLPIGAAQFVWHQILNNPRIKWEDNFTPFLGEYYSDDDVLSAIESEKDKINVQNNIEIDDIINLLEEQNIISVFNEGSESGRRALGNRSILADPRSADMKNIINEKVKHRSWFRPFAPSILRSEVNNWFTEDQDSPYMSFVLDWKEDKRKLIPAVVHVDGTARLQTVTENDNKWYFDLLTKWNEKTGVPILLNTSANSCEPIIEDPKHAIDLLLRTDINYLYFVLQKLLISKK